MPKRILWCWYMCTVSSRNNWLCPTRFKWSRGRNSISIAYWKINSSPSWRGRATWTREDISTSNNPPFKSKSKFKQQQCNTNLETCYCNNYIRYWSSSRCGSLRKPNNRKCGILWFNSKFLQEFIWNWNKGSCFTSISLWCLERWKCYTSRDKVYFFL